MILSLVVRLDLTALAYADLFALSLAPCVGGEATEGAARCSLVSNILPANILPDVFIASWKRNRTAIAADAIVAAGA